MRGFAYRSAARAGVVQTVLSGVVIMAEAPPPKLDWLIDYTPFRSLPLDQEALRIFESAFRVGLKTENESEPPISFSTLLIALLVGQDETSCWFADLAARIGPKPELVYAEKKFAKKTFKYDPTSRIAAAERARLVSDGQLLTQSAQAVLQNAEHRVLQVGGSDIGVRHLIASYVLNPPLNHRAQMQHWEFQESRWRAEFFPWVAARYTAEKWTEASYRPAPTQAAASFQQVPKISGATLAFPWADSTSPILEKASEFHASRGDTWLRLQTLFYALTETAKNDTATRAAIQPVWDAIQSVGEQYQTERDRFIPKSPSGDTTTTFSDLNLSPRVLTALDTARELAAAIWRERGAEFRVSAMHLAGALISSQVDGDAELSTLGLNPRELRLNLIEYAEGKGDSVEAWREALGEEDSLQSGRPVELNSDEPEAVVRLDEDWKTDPLLIRPDVEAFAALLASKSLEPPLSIGLFGPWGSGKTTFLRRLQRAVKRRATESKEARGKITADTIRQQCCSRGLQRLAFRRRRSDLEFCRHNFS
jgi:KAP family P-loop domain